MELVHFLSPGGVLSRRLRANPRYELVLFDRLAPAQQAALSTLQEDSDFYGLLRPRGGEAMNIKSVDQQTALLFLTLEEPGSLPQYARNQLGDAASRVVAQLVLDGLLEIEQGDCFVSGAEAYAVVSDEWQHSPTTSQNALTRLSQRALQYGQALEMANVQQLSLALYSYNRAPVTPALTRAYSTPEAIANHLGIDDGAKIQAGLARYWMPVTSSSQSSGWHAWRPLASRRTLRDTPYTYKLYVSPRFGAIANALDALVAISPKMRALSFKLGKDLYGLCRPDKFVIYFAEIEDLLEAAEAFKGQVSGCPSQGVPFTSAITDDGLLSWGIDPPRSAQTPLTGHRESWRLWLTNRLASAIRMAQLETSGQVEPWQFALQRIQLEGVDSKTWMPVEVRWR